MQPGCRVRAGDTGIGASTVAGPQHWRTGATGGVTGGRRGGAIFAGGQRRAAPDQVRVLHLRVGARPQVLLANSF